MKQVFISPNWTTLDFRSIRLVNPSFGDSVWYQRGAFCRDCGLLKPVIARSSAAFSESAYSFLEVAHRSLCHQK